MENDLILVISQVSLVTMVLDVIDHKELIISLEALKDHNDDFYSIHRIRSQNDYVIGSFRILWDFVRDSDRGILTDWWVGMFRVLIVVSMDLIVVVLVKACLINGFVRVDNTNLYASSLSFSSVNFNCSFVQHLVHYFVREQVSTTISKTVFHYCVLDEEVDHSHNDNLTVSFTY